MRGVYFMLHCMMLYLLYRGPHTFFLKQGKVQRWPGYLVNLIHYEDAARLCHAVRPLQPCHLADLVWRAAPVVVRCPSAQCLHRSKAEELRMQYKCLPLQCP